LFHDVDFPQPVNRRTRWFTNCTSSTRKEAASAATRFSTTNANWHLAGQAADGTGAAEEFITNLEWLMETMEDRRELSTKTAPRRGLDHERATATNPSAYNLSMSRAWSVPLRGAVSFYG
jgi:hypothetical protein